MICIEDKHNCVGCNGCKQICPKECIEMIIDDQGFNYPKVDLDKCINCHLCEKVCPVINSGHTRTPMVTYAAKNNDFKIKRDSSSGGIFYNIAVEIIKSGGIVFGARYDSDWNVVHDWIDNKEDIRLLMTSKYVQSSIGCAYKEALSFLNNGKTVLFSGTPCQIMGLKRYLRRDYGNRLITVEVICHGVPSPEIWREYVNFIKRKKKLGIIEDISFRDKTYGWNNYSLKIKGSNNTYLKTHRDDPYMQGFLKDLYIRPSCTQCPAKSLKSQSDISLGDFWHLNTFMPMLHDIDGISVVLVNSPNGMDLMEKIDYEKTEVDFSLAVKCVHAIVDSARKSSLSGEFWLNYHEKGINMLPKYILNITPYNHRIKKFVKKILKIN